MGNLVEEMAEQIVKLNEGLKALQKEKELDNIFWKQECDSLQKTLKEKDKEIEKLKNFMNKWHFENFESFENHYNYLMSLKNREQLMVENEAMKETIANLLGQKKTSGKEIRKQVCEEIRNLSAIDVINKIYIVDMEILDQIEQAKEQNKRE